MKTGAQRVLAQGTLAQWFVLNFLRNLFEITTKQGF